MKTVLSLTILILTFAFAARAQHEYAPVVEKEIKYKNWNYKNIRDGGVKEINLRDYAKNKKLVMVVYFAAWCPNWKLEAPIAQKFYDKYKMDGFDVIGVAEYETIEKTRANIDALKITFPVVYESDSSGAKQKTAHYEYRQKTGDTRNWGSPWNIFLMPANLKPKGDTLTEKTFIVNGELIETEAEAFIRQKLGLPAKQQKSPVAANDKTVETCTPDAKTTGLRKP